MKDTVEYDAMGMSPLKREALGECDGSTATTKRRGRGHSQSKREESDPEKRPHDAGDHEIARAPADWSRRLLSRSRHQRRRIRVQPTTFR